MIDRRDFLGGTLAVLLMSGRASGDEVTGKFEAQFSALEKTIKGRLGVAIVDTGSGQRLSHRGGNSSTGWSPAKLAITGCARDYRRIGGPATRPAPTTSGAPTMLQSPGRRDARH
jgi:hypothetical protein